MKIVCLCAEPVTVEHVQLAVQLRWPDAQVLVADDIETGLGLLESEAPDIVFLQYGEHQGSLSSLPGAIREIRRFSEVPLIALERPGYAGNMEEVRALEAGADDYLREGAGIIDLVARIVALMRRVWRQQTSSDGQVLTCGPLLLNPATYEVFLENKRLMLTSTEFRLLHLLVRNKGAVVTHRMIELSVWGDQVDRSAICKKYIQRLRRKLGDTSEGGPWIATVHGVGYRVVSVSDPNSLREQVTSLVS